MLEAVLFDLDDTLLGNSMDEFLPAYFKEVTCYFDDLVPARDLMSALMRATRAMDANCDEAVTNAEAFASVFYSDLGVDRSQVERAFRRFYAEVFPRLRNLTRRRPEARLLIEWAIAQGLQVAVTTNPMFPREAVEQRLDWAGVPVDDVDYALVTTYEMMHATKSHPAYYLEVLKRLGRLPEECLMVGDSWEMDIVPASSVGIHVYWVAEDGEVPALDVSLAGRGSLASLWETVENHGSLPVSDPVHRQSSDGSMLE